MNQGAVTAVPVATPATAVPVTTAAATPATTPITQAIRDFYSNIAGTPTSQQAEGDVTAFNKLAPSTADILKSFDTQYGVDSAASRVNDLRKSVMNAEDLVRNVDDNVFARTSGALVSDAQRARLTAAEKDPLTKQLDIINRSYDQANGDLTAARDQSNRFSSAEIGDITQMRGSLTDRLTTTQAREAADREKAKAEEENRQWWANYQEQVRQFNSNLDLQNRQLSAQVAASQRSSNDLLTQIRAASTANDRQTAINDQAAKNAKIAAANQSIKDMQASAVIPTRDQTLAQIIPGYGLINGFTSGLGDLSRGAGQAVSNWFRGK